jgi:hypothetical protein
VLQRADASSPNAPHRGQNRWAEPGSCRDARGVLTRFFNGSPPWKRTLGRVCPPPAARPGSTPMITERALAANPEQPAPVGSWPRNSSSGQPDLGAVLIAIPDELRGCTQTGASGRGTIRARSDLTVRLSGGARNPGVTFL